MSHAKYPFHNPTFPFRQHTTQTTSSNSTKHQILHQLKIQGLFNDLAHFLKKQNYTLVYPLLRKLTQFGSRKRELQESIRLELEILSFQQQEILERFQEMEEVGEQVRELLLLLKALSERETERGRGKEEFEGLERRLDGLAELFERNFISAPTKGLEDSESSSVGSEIDTSLHSLEEDTSPRHVRSSQSMTPEPLILAKKLDKRETGHENLYEIPHISDDDEFPFRHPEPPSALSELSAPGGRRRIREGETEKLVLHMYGGRGGASLHSPLKRWSEYQRLKAEKEKAAAIEKGKQKV